MRCQPSSRDVRTVSPLGVRAGHTTSLRGFERARLTAYRSRVGTATRTSARRSGCYVFPFVRDRPGGDREAARAGDVSRGASAGAAAPRFEIARRRRFEPLDERLDHRTDSPAVDESLERASHRPAKPSERPPPHQPEEPPLMLAVRIVRLERPLLAEAVDRRAVPVVLPAQQVERELVAP